MLELLALGLYGVQWLGVAMGVGAQTVILISHLLMLHEHKHPWLAYVAGARSTQATGLFLMAASGVGATIMHAFTGTAATLWQPAFGFKWMLIILLWAAYRLERPNENLWQGSLEGFAGATWFALFLIHTLAPVTSWANLFVLYVLWLVTFGVVWGLFAALMAYVGRSGTVEQLQPVQKAEPRPVSKPIPKPQAAPTPKPAAPPPPPPPPKPQPKPVVQPAPVIAAVAHTTPEVHIDVTPKVSLWSRLKKLFARKPKSASQKPAQAPAPVPAPVVQKPTPPPAPAPKVEAPTPAPALQPKPIVGQIPSVPVWPLKRDTPPPQPKAGLPVIARLEIVGPTTPVAPKPAEAKPAPVPEKPKEPAVNYQDLPAIQIMPQKPEEVDGRNRGPVVSLEDTVESRSKEIADAVRDI